MKHFIILGLLLVAVFAFAAGEEVAAMTDSSTEHSVAPVGEAPVPAAMPFAFLGAALGAGMIVIGAGLGIGKLAVAAAAGIARQPEAASSITGAINLPLFLLEGVAIIGLVVTLLIAIK